MLLGVERMRVDKAPDRSNSGNERHCLAQDIGDYSQEYDRDEDGLRFEVIDLLQDRAKSSQTQSCIEY